MAIIPLDTAAYQVGDTFTIPRRSLAKSPETVNATITRARKGTCEWIYTLAIDDGMKYGHWRVLTESQLRFSIREKVAAAA